MNVFVQTLGYILCGASNLGSMVDLASCIDDVREFAIFLALSTREILMLSRHQLLNANLLQETAVQLLDSIDIVDALYNVEYRKKRLKRRSLD